MDRLFEFRDFRISRVVTKGGEDIAESIHLVLGLTDRYPHDSIATHILDVVAQFLPALFTPFLHRDRVR